MARFQHLGQRLQRRSQRVQHRLQLDLARMAGRVGVSDGRPRPFAGFQRAGNGGRHLGRGHRLRQLSPEGLQRRRRNVRRLVQALIQLGQRHAFGEGPQRLQQRCHRGGIGLHARRQRRDPLVHLPLVAADQGDELLRLPTVQPGDGGEVGELLVGEHVRARRHHVVDVARVDHQHLVLQVLGLALVEEPQRAGQAARVEELGADGHHHVHVAGLHQLLADIAVLVACVGRAGRHHEAGPTGVVQVAVEVLDPQAVGVGDGAGLGVGARQAEGQAQALAHLRRRLLGVHAVHVERRVRHHEVAAAHQMLGLVVEGVALRDIGRIQSVHH